MSSYKATHLAHSVGTTSTNVLKHNMGRQYAVLVNNSDTIIYIALGTPASATKGIRLNANGGSYEINYYNLFKGEIYAYCSATKQLLTTEW